MVSRHNPLKNHVLVLAAIAAVCLLSVATTSLTTMASASEPYRLEKAELTERVFKG